MKVLVIVSLIFLAASTNCGGNCPGGCDSCPCGSSPSSQSISSWCSQYSGWSQACCQCIVSHESGGNANAVNQNTGGSYDVGLWQINDMNWGSCSGGSAPCNPSTNLGCAKKVFAWGGNTWKLWSTCGGCGCCGKAQLDKKLAFEQELISHGFDLSNFDFLKAMGKNLTEFGFIPDFEERYETRIVDI